MAGIFQVGEKCYKIEDEDMAKYLLRPEEKRNEKTTHFLATMFVESCYQLSKKKLEVLDNPLLIQGLKKAEEIISGYFRTLTEEQKKVKKEIKDLRSWIDRNDYNEHQNFLKAEELSRRLNKLGLFHGKEKKELREQIEELRKPLQVPSGYTERIKELETIIAANEEKLKEYDALLRGCNWANQELLLKGKTYNGPERPQEALQGAKKDRGINSSSDTLAIVRDKLKQIKSIE